MPVILSLTIVLSFLGYSYYEHSLVSQNNTNTNSNTVIVDRNTIQPLPSNDGSSGDTTNNPVITPKPKPTPTPVPTPKPAPAPKGLFVDGTYTGRAVDVYYGIVQVQALVNNGKLTNVSFLSYPNDNPTSLRKANNAMPILISEAISAQSASVNSVSGASRTSAGFVESLGDALSQAKI